MIRFVYVAGPITSHPMHNTHNALKEGDKLMEAGFIPFVPHAMLMWDMISPKHYEKWMEYDFAWIERCDALVRIPGVSPGADREIAHAKEKGIPIFFGVDEFLASVRNDGHTH